MTSREDPSATPGTLFVVATPIGNLGDFSARAITTLRQVDLILAEDTRTFHTLAKQFEINAPVQSYHEHNERRVTEAIGQKLLRGISVALVSEAGTPTISDPGYRLIRFCREHRLRVESIPGPSAVIAALSISGLETHAFRFAGFLPQKAGKKRAVLSTALESEETTVFFESPHRIIKTLGELKTLAPERRIFLCRELTKKYEETFFGSVTDVALALGEHSTPRGEFVLIIGCSKH